MIATFYAGLNLPDTCRLGQRVFKKQIIAHAPLNSAAQKMFQTDVETISWAYTLKPTTIPIPPYHDEDGEREYGELNILHVQLRQDHRYQRIAEIMHRAIPYPLLLLFSWQTNIALTLADKRLNRADQHKTVVEKVYDTGWLSLATPTASQADFLADFALPNFSYQNFYALHQDMVRRIVALNRADYTNQYQPRPPGTGPLNVQIAQLAALEALAQEAATLRHQLKREKNLGQQVNLNVRLKQLADQITKIKQSL